MDGDVEDFLVHYGVKGMKWGVRKKDKQSRRERKAKEYDAEAARIQKLIDGVDAKIASGGYRKSYLHKQKEALVAQKQTAVNDAEAKRQGKMTSREKDMAKKAAIAAGILAAYGTYTLAQSGEMNRKILQGKQYLTRSSKVWNKKDVLAQKDLSPDEIMLSVVQKINPNYGMPGTKVNCRRCTFAYEMRRRGYDVAATRTTNAHGQSLIGMKNALDESGRVDRSTGKVAALLKTAKALAKDKQGETSEIGNLAKAGGLAKKKIESSLGSPDPAQIFNALSREPNRSRGELAVSWAIGGAHSIAYEVINGKPVLFDTQLGKKMSSPDDMKKVYKLGGETSGFLAKLGVYQGISEAGFTRLDNVPLNENFLMRWLKNA